MSKLIQCSSCKRTFPAYYVVCPYCRMEVKAHEKPLCLTCKVYYDPDVLFAAKDGLYCPECGDCVVAFS